LVVTTAMSKSVSVENVVVSADTGTELDLEAVNSDIQHADFTPDNFPGIIYRNNEPKFTGLLFRSGKIVCTGTTSVSSAKTAVGIMIDELKDLGVPVSNHTASVENIVTTTEFETQFNLSSVAVALGLENIEYEPEIFPGLVYRNIESGVVILLFSSGKGVVTGASSIEEATRGATQIADTLKEFQLL